MEADRLSPSAHVVFHRLCLMHDDKISSQGFLAKAFARERRAQLNPKTVYAALDELESLGLIRRERTRVWLSVPLNLELLKGPLDGPFEEWSELGDMSFPKGPKNGPERSEKRSAKVQKAELHLIQTEEQGLGAANAVRGLTRALSRCAVSAEAGMPWLNPKTRRWEQPEDFARVSAELLVQAGER